MQIVISECERMKMSAKRLKVFRLPYLITFLVTTALSLVFVFLHPSEITAANSPQNNPSPNILQTSNSTNTKPVTENNTTNQKTSPLPIEQQPFYAQLEKKKVDVSNVIDPPGLTPQETFLDFYVSMAQIYHGLGDLMKDPSSNNDLFWSAEVKTKAQEYIDKFEELLTYFDFSQVPISIKHSVSVNTTLQLKELFDYVISHSDKKIDLYSGFKAGQKVWSFPHTLLTLTKASQTPANLGSIQYSFSKEIIDIVSGEYPSIATNATISTLKDHKDTKTNWYYTPNFSAFEAFTPGYLLIPKWYLMLPVKLRHFLQIADSSKNTIGEYIIYAIVLIVSLIILSVILRLILKLNQEENLEDTNEEIKDNTRLFHSIGFLSKQSGVHHDIHTPDEQLDRTFRELEQIKHGISLNFKNDSKIFLLLGVFAVNCITSSHAIEYYANISGTIFQVTKSLYLILLYVNASFSVFVLVKWAGLYYVKYPYLGSKKRKRITVADLKKLLSTVASASTMSGYLLSLAFFYALLTDLGLPSEAVLAFSAVPGLAIGLGASKVLSNIFAAISIKGDRPIQVGDFCEINSIKGFVLGIGVRSVVINSPNGLITIPNAKVDDETIINHTYYSEDINPVKLVNITWEFNFTKPFTACELVSENLEILEKLQRPFSTDTLNKVEKELNKKLGELDYVYDYYVDMDEDYEKTYIVRFKAFIGAQIESWKDYFNLENILDSVTIESLVNDREASDISTINEI